jgi:hypothetical protein
VNVELHIEELLLHGFPPDYRHRVGDALEHELSRLFTERGVPPSLARGGDIPHLNAGGFQINPELGAEAVGARVARSLYGGLDPQGNVHGNREGSTRQTRTNDQWRIT